MSIARALLLKWRMRDGMRNIAVRIRSRILCRRRYCHLHSYPNSRVEFLWRLDRRLSVKVICVTEHHACPAPK